MTLEDQVVLLTGATGGLGRALARKLAGAGARLVLTARDEDALDELAGELGGEARARTVVADLSRPGEAGELLRNAESAWGRIDVLINNAGAGYFALADESSPDVTRRLFELNTLSPWELARAVLPGMRERDSGAIVNVISCQGRVPMPTTADYGGAKTALAAMANTMRFELGKTPIRVLNVYPGTLDTRFEDHAMRESRRPGICVSNDCGTPVESAAADIAAALGEGRSGDLWLDRRARRVTLLAALWPSLVERFLRRVRDWAVERPTDHVPHEERKWRLWQLESSLACNLGCVMCPWTTERCSAGERALMSEEVWESVRPHLSDIAALDFTGGGEPLLNPRLPGWMREAKEAGCTVGFLSNGMLLTAEKRRELVDLGADWIAVSLDGATREVYEGFRPGAAFDVVTGNLRELAAAKQNGAPRLMINFVMMDGNADQIEDIVSLAADLGVDVVNLKQADVARGEDGAGFGLFRASPSTKIEELERRVARAKRLGDKLGVEVRSARFRPEEEPVCEQDPRSALFVRHDGTMAPCINLAIGGPTTFLGKPVTMPSVTYGRLPEDDPREVWDRPPCTRYRHTFSERDRVYWRRFSELGLSPTMSQLENTRKEAEDAMPEPPEGCRNCHYLYGL